MMDDADKRRRKSSRIAAVVADILVVSTLVLNPVAESQSECHSLRRNAEQEILTNSGFGNLPTDSELQLSRTIIWRRLEVA